MKNKKIIMLLLLICVAVSFSLHANAEGEASGSGSKEISILYRDNASYPVQDDWLVWDLIEESTGVRMNTISAPDSSYVAKMQIVIASGEAPEIIASTAPAQAGYANYGLVLPISDYWHLLPNMKNYLDTYGYERELSNLTLEDGKIYTLPIKTNTELSNIKSWMIRTDIFDKHNIPYPQTMDDIYQAGKQLKEIYPDSSPIINRFTANNCLSDIAHGFGTRAGWNLSTNGHEYDEATDSYIFVPGAPNFKEFLVYTKKLLDEGILNEEFNSMASSTYEQLVIQGETFILMDWVGNQVRYNVNGSVHTDPDYNIWPIIPPQGPYGDYAMGAGQKYTQWWLLNGNLKDRPDFEEIMAFIDWFYSEEGSIVTTFGKEGITYEVGSDGRLNFIDPNVDYSREYGMLNNSLNVRQHPDWFVAMNGDDVEDLFDDMRDKGVFRIQPPTVVFTEEEGDELQLLVPTLDEYIRSMTLKYIYGDESLDEFDAFLEECDNKGAAALTVLINNAYERTKNQ